MNIIIRKWERTDRENLAYYANNKNIVVNLRDIFPHPYTLESADWYINDCIEKGEEDQCLRAIVVDRKAVGGIGFTIGKDVYRKTAEIGYWLGEEYWGKGIMSKALREVYEYAFSHYDLERVYADVFSFNIASQKVLENAGFQLEGILKRDIYKNGQVWDTYKYALLNEKSGR